LVRQSSSNAERAADLLLILGEAGSLGMSLAQLAEATGDAKSAVHRSLVALGSRGLVIQSGTRGNYRLGPTLYALAHRVPAVGEIIRRYRPALIATSARVQRSTYLMMRAGVDIACLDLELGVIAAQPFVSGIGGRIPLSVSPAGIVMLAKMDDRSRQVVFDQNASALQQWKLSLDQIEADIAAYRQTGYVRGVRSTLGIESLALALPVLSDTWLGLEVAMSVLTPIGSLTQEQELEIVAVMREELARIDEADRQAKAI
jgi:DNA-binding IclR family transcriptional regulator